MKSHDIQHEHTQADQEGLLLPGLDGSNPAHFLASLGVLQILSAVNPTFSITLSWNISSGTWRPQIHGVPENKSSLAEIIAQYLACPFQPNTGADANRNDEQKKLDVAKSKLKMAREGVKKQGLRGEARKNVEAEKVMPLQEEYDEQRDRWLATLKGCVPFPELSLGKHLDATGKELRKFALWAVERVTRFDREAADILASFGCDCCVQEKNQRMESTPFCFISGSGHQYFLDTVRQLFSKVDASRLDAALFQYDAPCDEKLSMRWDPIEDRRHALMWDDPTAQGNKARTNWAINLLAYRGLQVLPSMPGSHRLRTVGWSFGGNPYWTWPIWDGCISLQIVRSLLSHPLLSGKNIDGSALKEMGIVGVYRVFRLQVGKPPLHKINFTPALCIL